VRDPEARDALGAAPRERPAVELDRAAAAHGARDRAQRRRLAGAVRSEQRDDLAVVDRQGDAVQGVDRPVPRIHVPKCEERRHREP
jgi:hypothetical protein